MHDRHLNLFYPYNQDSELVENNLTRAWLVSLRLLSGKTRDFLLRSLLTEPVRQVRGSRVAELPSFLDAHIALQGHIDKAMIKRLPHRYIITIAGDECEELEDSNSSQDLRSITSQEPYPGSIPDGWIYDENQGYCYLVECKVGTNPLNERQIRSHAREWLAIDDLRDLRDRILPLTWTDVAGAIEQVIKEADSGALPVGEQEWQVMTDLEEYLGFFGYRVFRGLDFTLLMRPPDFARLLRHVRQARIRLDFSGLIQPPEFRLNRT